ncbi:MAG: fructose 1,6-bisphosphatase [Thermodesulfobacteriota bacterium]|nr:fructose 1,6-bisphosphatase [Thermodesulfobacteriota bacterium]
MTFNEFEAQESKRITRRATITIVSANVIRWLGGVSSIPREVVEAGEAILTRAKEKGDIRGCRVYAFGKDMHLQVNTLGAGLQSLAAHRLIFEAIDASFLRAADAGLYRPVNGQDYFRLNPGERIAALRLRPVEFPFTERGSEPIYVAKLINGAVGSFNRMLFNLFFHPDKGSHQRLDGTRFLAIVENANDLRAGQKQRRLYAFGDRPLEDKLFLIYPFLRKPLEFDRHQVGDWAELLSMIANPAEWVVSAIYAVNGRYVIHGEELQATRHEPVAVVSVESAHPNSPIEDPVLILRLQSGLPAVGEANFSLGADFHFIIGGPGGGYHIGVMPITMAEARTSTEEVGTARLVAYTYQSYDNGRIPPEHDVIDIFSQDRVQTEWLQKEARQLIQPMLQQGEFQPYVTAEEAERRALVRAEHLSSLFKPIPSVELGEIDPLIARANECSGGETLSDIKADAGGKVGHTTPTTLFQGVARASLEQAREGGVIRDFQVFAVGDDMHLLMAHGHGVDANNIHLLAFRTFWRMVWVTEIIGYKPYGLAQDLKIGPATKGKHVDDLAEPSDRFMELLAKYLPEPEKSYLDKMHGAQLKWKRGRGEVEVLKPFAGNVTGQGPGFAELPLKDTLRVGLLGADKAGPAAFNIPVFHGVEKALAKESFRSRYGESLAFEIFAVHNHKRIFLDGRAHREDIAALLGATNLFNIKRLWSLPRTVNQKEAVESSVCDILLAASTEKLALITGGEYVGKDDPVLLGVEELVNQIFEYMKTGFYMTQGDERGSHYMMLSPKPLPEAVATVRSRGLQVGLMVTLNPTGIVELQDVYAAPSFREARIRIEQINARFWRAQGSEFTPVGVGARDVEPAYPLMKVLNRLTREGSPYARAIQSVTQDLYQQIAEALSKQLTLPQTFSG